MFWNLFTAGQIRIFAKDNFNAKFILLLVAVLPVPIPVNFISFHASELSQNEYYYGCPYNVRRTELYLAGDAPISEDVSFTQAQVDAECTSYSALDEDQLHFRAINSIYNSQPDGYAVRLPVYVLAHQNVKILLSSTNRPSFETDKIYQIGKCIIWLFC